MTDLRQAAQMALEFLMTRRMGGESVITALRTALEQQQAEPVQKPVEGNTLLKAFLADAKEAGVTHLQQSEPVAWMTPDGEGFRLRFSPPQNNVPLGWDALYTAPPQRQWVGLTDEEIKHEWEVWRANLPGFARAIEAKLKELNGY
jgi:hypothetical protein